MRPWITLRAVVLLRRLVRCEEARLALEKLRYERDYLPVPAPKSEPRKTEIAHPTVELWNAAHEERQNWK